MKDSFIQNYQAKKKLLAEIETTISENRRLQENPPHYPSYINRLCGSLDPRGSTNGPFLSYFPPLLREKLTSLLNYFYYMAEGSFRRFILPFSIYKNRISTQIFGPLFELPWSDPDYVPYGESIYYADDKGQDIASLLLGRSNSVFNSEEELYGIHDEYKSLGIKNLLHLFFYDLEKYGSLPLQDTEYKALEEMLDIIFPLIEALTHLKATLKVLNENRSDDYRLSRYRCSDIFLLAVYLKNIWLKQFTSTWHSGGHMKSIQETVSRISTEMESVAPMEFSGELEEFEKAKARIKVYQEIFASFASANSAFSTRKFTRTQENFFLTLRNLVEIFYSAVVGSVLHDRFMMLGFSLQTSTMADGHLVIKRFYKNIIERNLLKRLADWLFEKRNPTRESLENQEKKGNSKKLSRAPALDKKKFDQLVLKSYRRFLDYFEKGPGLQYMADGSAVLDHLGRLDIREKIRGRYVEEDELVRLSLNNRKVLYDTYENIWLIHRRIRNEIREFRYFTPYYLVKILQEMRNQLMLCRECGTVVVLINQSDELTEKWNKAMEMLSFNIDRLSSSVF